MKTIKPVIEMQPASIDVWAQKYQLKDKNGKVVDATIDDTFKRVARALADVEPEKKDYWYNEFLWAMRNGAIPAGRILSNAGAQDYKQSTSLINCTVSDTVYDSMDSILSKLHEAGMTLKAGCGAGYCFSTIRPRGAYVNGAGAYTSGPLSFMDIYDKMCFTVSSAGGRRGAQMATFDVGHPDVLEFIRAKREDGRLRQFNLSLLATDSFMEAVIHNLDWPLAFPLTPKEANQDNIDIYDSSKVLWRSWPTTEGYIVSDEGNVACRIYRTIKAQKLWDEIMRSTYDFAEPGIIFIDEVNKMNNNFWCEYVQASNPCVAQGTLVLTPNGFVPVEDLCYGDLIVTASGTAKPIIEIETHFDAMLYDVELSNGAKITVTKDHIFHSKKENKLHEPWDSHTRLKDLKEGDYLKIVCSDFRDTNIPKEQIEIPIPIKSITFSGKRGTVYDIYEKETDTWVTEYGIVSRGCGEQMLPPYGACLLGSIDLTKFVVNPFSDDAYFDFGSFEYVVAIFSRMLDNVVEINGLPLEQQRNELTRKRRHGMGYMGLGSALTMMKIKYGSPEAIKFTEALTFTMAHVGFQQGLALANEKGPAPIMHEMFLETPKEFGKNLFCRSNYIKKLEAKDADLVHKLETYGSRYTHATSIAPTGCVGKDTMVVTDNGIERITRIGDTSGNQWQDIDIKVSTDYGFKKATKFFVNGYKQIVKITTSSGRTFVATPNHQVKTINIQNGYGWTRMDELTVGDLIPSIVDNYPKDIFMKKLNKYVSPHNGDTRYDKGYFKNPDYLSPRIAELIGFLHSNGNTKTSRHVRFFHHIDYSNDVFSTLEKTLLDEFGIVSSRKQSIGEQYANLKELHIHSKPFVDWLIINGFDKDKSSNIRIPDSILTGGRDVVYSYIRGIFEGDGSNTGNSFSITSVSDQFISDLQIILQSIGIVSVKDISVKGNSNNHFGNHDVHRLSISNYIDRIRFIENIGFMSCKGKGGKTKICSRNTTRRQMSLSIYKTIGKSFKCNTLQRYDVRKKLYDFEKTISNELHYEEIKKIENGYEDTYDLSVPENLTYTANNLVSHNTLSLSVGNNISNGIEPSFAHQYSRNIIKEGKKTKEKVDVYSYEFLAYKTLVDPNATVDTLPDYFVTADSITPEQHVDMQAAAQKWIDSSLSKTVNCPSDYPYEKFKNLYMYAYEKGVKGLATFRFNPTRFQGVLVRNEDLANTTYQFTLADGSTVKAAGNEQIDYDGEIHTAANLFDAIKEGLYGKF